MDDWEKEIWIQIIKADQENVKQGYLSAFDNNENEEED